VNIEVDGSDRRAAKVVSGELARGAGSRQRRLISYLAVPRPKDMVKGSLIPVTYLVGVLATGGATVESIVRAAVVVAAVELLIYPARYQWNDVRGFVADQRHPDSASRGRLPGPMAKARAHVLATCVVAAVRLILVGVLVLALPGLHLGAVLAFATAGVFSVAIVYEWLRSRFTGRTAQIPPPLRLGLLSVWLVVGAGYAVRGMIGLGLAVELPARPALALAATVTLWGYGVAFVTSRWAVEATAFASLRDGQVTFEASPDQAREHLMVLIRWLPGRLRLPERDVQRWRPLSGRTSLTAPWNVAMVVAGSSSVITGRLMCGPASAGQLIAVAVAGAAITVAVLLASRSRLISVLVGAALLLGFLAVTGCPRPLLGMPPWLLLSAAHLYFSTRSLHALGQPGVVTRAVKASVDVGGRWLLSSATWAAVRANDRDDGAEREGQPSPVELVDVACRAATVGARVAMRWWADHTRLEVQQKRGPRDLVSRADRETEAAIREILLQLRPDDSVLGEEGGSVDGTSDIRWVVDPIDGTTSYLYGRPDWAVSVAAVSCTDDTVVASAVVEPVAGWTTTAQRGRGTYLNGRRITVNDVRSLDHAVVEINFGRDDQREVAGLMVAELAPKVRDLRRGGSAASALAHVATGRADAVWAPGLQAWDCAAGVLLVEEAGGTVGDLREITPGRWPGSGDVLAGNPVLWAALRAILTPVYALKV
jgi:fructose-1,6-bisphosphatase/inositol monophosphatase family enzyme